MAVLLLVACAGAVGGYLLLRSPQDAASGPVTAQPLSTAGGGLGPSASPSAVPAESQEPAQGPWASAYPAEEIYDLNRVCDENVYYPQSPKRAGKAPHPVVVLVMDRPGVRYQDGTYYYSQGISNAAEQTWAASTPGKVQMVACLDRVGTGGKIRDCKFDEPKPDTVPLMQASWHLRVYEAATARKLLDKPLAGDDRSCPYVVTIGADRKIYAEVSNRALVAALRNLVTK